MSCDSCNNNKEDVRHYIFFCPAFAAQRQSRIEGLTALFPTAVMQNKQSLLNILLYGSKYHSNNCVFAFHCIFN